MIGAFLFGRKENMVRKKFHVRIRAFGYVSNFDLEAIDSIEGVEKGILDKIGEKCIVWEEDEFYDKRKCFITYEEVKDGSRQLGDVR